MFEAWYVLGGSKYLLSFGVWMYFCYVPQKLVNSWVTLQVVSLAKVRFLSTAPLPVTRSIKCPNRTKTLEIHVDLNCATWLER